MVLKFHPKDLLKFLSSILIHKVCDEDETNPNNKEETKNVKFSLNEKLVEIFHSAD